MKLTIDRVFGPVVGPTRFALTVSIQGARDLALETEQVSAALARAADLVQALVFPTPAPDWRHPQDYALFQWTQGSGLFRAVFSPGATAEDLITPAYRYVPDAYDARGKLLPVFWSLPVVNLEPLATL